MGTVADLVVSLNADDEAIAGEMADRVSVRTSAESAEAAIEDEEVVAGFGELWSGVVEVGVVSLLLPSQQGMNCVVKIIVPLGIRLIAPAVVRFQDPSIVKIAFRDDVSRPVTASGLGISDLLDFREDMSGTGIADGMNRIETETIEMKISQPISDILQNETANT